MGNSRKISVFSEVLLFNEGVTNTRASLCEFLRSNVSVVSEVMASPYFPGDLNDLLHPALSTGLNVEIRMRKNREPELVSKSRNCRKADSL